MIAGNSGPASDNTPARKGVSAAAVQAALQAALSPDELAVQDDSAAHAGHAGAREGSHLSVRIVSARFANLSRVARHRLVYDALRFLIPEGVHALAIDAKSPDAKTPDARIPGTKIPDTNLPDATAPDAQTPDAGTAGEA